MCMCVFCVCAGSQLQCVLSCVCECVCVCRRGWGGSRQRECDLLSGTQSSDTAPSLAPRAASPPSLPFPPSFLSSLRLPPAPLLSLRTSSLLLSSASPPPSFAPSLHLRGPTQTSMNNSDRVALQVFPLSSPAASSPHPPIFLQKPHEFFPKFKPCSPPPPPFNGVPCFFFLECTSSVR